MLPYDLGPHDSPIPFGAKWLTPNLFFFLPVCMYTVDRLHQLAREGAGGPKSYDSIESLVQSSTVCTVEYRYSLYACKYGEGKNDGLFLSSRVRPIKGTQD